MAEARSFRISLSVSEKEDVKMNMDWFRENGVDNILFVQLLTDGVGASCRMAAFVFQDMEGEQKTLYVNDPEADFSRLSEFGGPAEGKVREEGKKPFYVLPELSQIVFGADMLVSYNRKFFTNAVSNTPFEDVMKSRPMFDICEGFTLIQEGRAFPYETDSATALCAALPIAHRSKCSFTRLVKDYVKPPASQELQYEFPLLKNINNLRMLWGIMTGLL
jgi:hypothetical protein